MRTSKIYSMIKNAISSIVVIAMVITLSSCGTTNHFQGSSIVPAAEGVVKVKKDNNKNYAIRINIANLAEPNRLQPAKNTYVVWMEGENNETKNIGQIKSSKSLFSKSLKGSFETVSSIKPKKVFVTAENDPSVQYPDNSEIVLTTNYLRD